MDPPPDCRDWFGGCYGGYIVLPAVCHGVTNCTAKMG